MCLKTWKTSYSWIELHRLSILFYSFRSAHICFNVLIKSHYMPMSAFISSDLNPLLSSIQGTAGCFHLIMTGNSSHTHLDNATLALFTDVNTSITISAIYIVVTAINLVGNTLSLWILLFRTSPKTISIIFMIHLTLTDLALGIALPFQITYQLHSYHWTLGPRMCRYFFYIFKQPLF